VSASRKLYTALAAGFKQISGSTDDNDRQMFRTTVYAAAVAFKADNSGFDGARFLRASGFTDEEVRAYSALV
jgi:hypothetical protein